MDAITFDVSVLNLLKFGGPNMMEQGDQVYQSNHLLQVGVCSVGESTCTIQAICVQSSHPDNTPHTITIKTGDSFPLWTFHCSCKAGAGARCKHIYAVLLHIHTHRQLEVLTCTQLSQQWGKIAKTKGTEILKSEKIRNLPEFKKYADEEPEYQITPDEFSHFRDELFSEPNTAIAIFLYRSSVTSDNNLDHTNDTTNTENNLEVHRSYHDDIKIFLSSLFNETDFGLRNFIFSGLSANLKNFYNKRVCVNTEESIKINMKTSEQKNQLWMNERKLRITASECYSLYTAFKNPRTNWPKKIKQYYKKKPELINLKIGRREELNAITLYETIKKLSITKFGICIHPTCPWLGCSPDGLCLTEGIVVEVKTLISRNVDDTQTLLKKCSFLRSNGDNFVFYLFISNTDIPIGT